jgi:hypothetical protein
LARRVKPELPAAALPSGRSRAPQRENSRAWVTIDGRLALQEYVNALLVDFDKADTDSDGVSVSPLLRLGAHSRG